jgi:quinoprotein glucose dehydrogenase
MRPFRSLCAIGPAIALAACRAPHTAAIALDSPLRSAAIEWTAYGRDPAGTRYSPAGEITRDNVRKLEVAWVYRTGDYLAGDAAARVESTPLFVDGTLFVSTPLGTVIALDPERGRERWRFDPRVDLSGDYGDFANRGVSTWLDTASAAGEPCRRRIFVAPIDARLIALDAATGRPCEDFGTRGEVDLTRGLRNPPRYKGEYAVTSPPAVLNGLVIVGSAVADNQRTNAPSGVVRAYDARTGAHRWTWDPIPRDSTDPAWRTWRGPKAHDTGAANAWSILSADAERDLVFIPVGSASPDYYGGERKGENLYGSSVVALRGATGKVVWHFQTVHHDLWDYDVPAQPVLVTLRRDGHEIPAVIQATKMGHLFVLHRETGEPLFPVEERPVPQSDVPGEESWPTQPFPVLPKPLVPERLTADDAWGITPADRAWCRDRIAAMRSEGIFTPPSLQGTVVFPGAAGGSNWSGLAVDPERGIVVAPTNRVAMTVRLIPRDRFSGLSHEGRFKEHAPQAGTPYGLERDVLLTPQGVPCNAPPWGALTAIDLATGEQRWERPLGTTPALAGMPSAEEWGSLNFGGAMTTASGLVFAAGTYDERLHAYDIDTGRELWSAKLPAGGNATPMTYQTASGRQYVVIAAGGHNIMRTTPGDFVVAFALPGAAQPDAQNAAVPTMPLDSVFTGELRIGRNRFPTQWHLRQDGNAVRGDLTVSEPRITGPLTGTRADSTLHFTITFDYPSRGCRGTMEGTGALVNAGTVLEGDLRVRSTCSDKAEEIGTFVMRPRPPAGR